jgi:hypothetical protein
MNFTRPIELTNITLISITLTELSVVQFVCIYGMPCNFYSIPTNMDNLDAKKSDLLLIFVSKKTTIRTEREMMIQSKIHNSSDQGKRPNHEI